MTLTLQQTTAIAELVNRSMAHSVDPQPLGLESLTLNGKRVSARVTKACQKAEELETMEGAGTFVLSLLDPEGDLERSGLFDSAVDLRVKDYSDGDEDRFYRLVKLASAWPLLTVTFEDQDVAYMRTHKKFKRASRSKMTRIQFGISMVREVKKRRIKVFAPESKKKQPIAKDVQQAKRKSKGGKGHRFPAGASIKVKGVEATSAQKKVLDDVMEQTLEQGGTRRGLIGNVMCVTVESQAQNLKGGDADSVGAYQQRASQGWPASRVVKRDAKAFNQRFLPSVKANPGTALGTLVANVQRPREDLRGEYAKWEDEATATVDAWLGEEGGGVESAGSYTKRYEFTRGEPGKPEDTWAALGRLMDEVNIRRFMRRGELWLVSETWLSKRPVKVSWSRRSPGVQSISYDADFGKLAQTATVVAFVGAGKLKVGDGVQLRDLAKPANGRYLVNNIRRDPRSLLLTYELKRKTGILPEPASETVQRSGDTTKTGGPGKGSGSYDWPVDPHPVTSPFGARAAPKAGASTNHDGIDFGVPTGTPVVAVDGGKVTKAGPNGNYGLYVEIDHGGGMISFSAHLSKIDVSVGAKVEKGATIGKVGNTGNSTGPHLHFGMHFRGKPVDPAKYLGT